MVVDSGGADTEEFGHLLRVEPGCALFELHLPRRRGAIEATARVTVGRCRVCMGSPY